MDISEYRDKLMDKTVKIMKARGFKVDDAIALNLLLQDDDKYAKMVDYLENHPKADMQELLLVGIDISKGNPIGTEENELKIEKQKFLENKKRKEKYNS